VGYSQSLVQTVNLPSDNFFNYSYGLVYNANNYWISSDNLAGIKSVDENGNYLSTININYPGIHPSQGLAFDGTNFWYVERKTARCDLFKISQSGTVLDSITAQQLFGTNYGIYMGGAAWDGTGLWISLYYPNEMAALYKVDVTAKQIVDTIQVYGIQPTGITVKGDTLFYVMDGFEGDPENIYAVNLATHDTLFSWHVPEVPGSRQNPRGLAWDGSYFWLLAEPVSSSSGRQLFKYDLTGGGSPHISVSSNSLTFPQTTVGDTSHLYLSVSNIGNADLEITNITFNNSVFSSPAGPFPITIPPGDDEILQVDFHPSDFTYYTGVMSIESNDVTTPVVNIDLSGQGVVSGATIQLTASSHNFGDVWVNADGTTYWSFGILNTGSGQLQISNMHFNQPEFSFESEPIPFQIAPTDTSTIRLKFTPSHAGAFADTLFISSNDVQHPLVTVTVTGNGVQGSYDIGYQFWSYQVPDNPRVSYEEYRVEGLKPINDINGDGINDVIIATDNYFIMALDGAGSGTTDTLWSLNTFFNNSNAGSIGQTYDYGVQDAIAIVSDLNGDGRNDVVIGTGGSNEHVYAINGMNGHVIWGFGDDVNYGLGDFEAVDGQRDFNGDGVPDILAIADGNEEGTGYHRAYLFNGVNGNMIWQYIYPGPSLAFGKTIISVDDVTGDGVPDAVIDVGNNGTTDLDVICLNGTNGQVKWTFPVTGYEPKELLELPIPGQTSDVVASQYFGKIYRIDGETGAQVWAYDYGFTGVIQISRIRDVNGDNIDDILVAALSGSVICLSGSNGQVIWNYPMNYQYGVAAVPDLNNDGVDDMITGDQDGTFYCISGTGSPLFFSHTFGGDRIVTVNALPSIDGNASYELLGGTKNGKVVCFSGGLNAVPVELISFNASLNGVNVTLTWTTASQLNNRGFEIERKSGNGDYQSISFIKGDGTTTEQKSYSYTDKELQEGDYTYRLKQIDFDSSVHYSGLVNVSVKLPAEFNLSQNYPNPFNPSTTINFSLPQKQMVKLIVYDILGKEVKTLVNGEKDAGSYNVQWNGTNNNGVNVSTGIYIYRITAGSFIQEKKMILMK
jgi:outer membrane protein assembly factor BamB